MGKQVFNPYKTTLTQMDFVGAATVATTAAKWVEIGRVTIPAGTAYALGFGEQNGQDSAQGRLYMDTKDSTPAVEAGMIRFEIRDPQDRPVKTVFESRTESVTTSATDRTQQLPFAERSEMIGEDFAIIFQFKGDASDLINKANSKFLIDTTVYSVR